MIKLINNRNYEGDDMNYCDNRRREAVFPTRIIKVGKTVENPQGLLMNRDTQAAFPQENCTVLRGGEIILDFGKEIHGTLHLVSYWNEHAEHECVRITFGESVAETMSTVGKCGATNDHAPRDIKLCLPSLSTVCTSETGFRFVRIKVIGKQTVVSLKSVFAMLTTADIDEIGSFSCDDPLLNKIYDTCAYTCKLNIQNYIWDGIKRDRLVWIGDVFPEMITVKTVFGNIPQLADTMRFAKSGAPIGTWINGFPSYSGWWIIVLYEWYFYTGDAAFLEENRTYAMQLLKQICDCVDKDGVMTLPQYFLDWPSYEKPQGITGAVAVMALALKRGEKLALLCGEKDTAALCTEKYRLLATHEYACYGAKQTAAMLWTAGLRCDRNANELVLENGAQNWSTFMSYFLSTCAADHDMQSALDAIRQYYGGMLSLGATTFWEDFDLRWCENATPIDELPQKGKIDVHGTYGDYCYKGYRHSLCHGWSSGITAFLCEQVLGIRVCEAGCKKIEIRPQLGDLNEAEGTFPTPYGVLSVRHKKCADGTVKTEYTAPAEIKVVVR